MFLGEAQRLRFYLRYAGLHVAFYLRLAGQSEDMSVRPSGTVLKKGESQFEGFPELLQMIKRNANLRDFPELLQFLQASTTVYGIATVPP